MIITGGFHVYSTDVEQALLAHSDVQDCAVLRSEVKQRISSAA